MTLTTFPAIDPSFGSSPKIKMRVLEAQFGDGYTQRAGDGLNVTQSEWNVVFNDLIDTEAETIRAFLEARAGVEAFYWTPPGEAVARKWTASSYAGPTPTAFDSNTIQANFREEYDL